MNIKYILLVGAGSFVGGVGRFLMSVFFKQHFSVFPLSLILSTFMVNIVGCFCIGFLYAMFYKNWLTMPWVLFSCVGIMGGFTTFSAFSYETMNLLINKQIFYAIFYAAGSVVVGLLFTYIGFWIMK